MSQKLRIEKTVDCFEGWSTFERLKKYGEDRMSQKKNEDHMHENTYDRLEKIYKQQRASV